MDLSRMIRVLVLAALASALVYAVMIGLSDGPAVMAALAGFSPITLGVVFALSVACYFLRAVRWAGIMRRIGAPIRLGDAVYLQFAGQTMSISPGRVGEVLKPWLAREIVDLPMSRGLALVFAERVADLIAVCLLSLGGLSALRGGFWGLLAALAALVAGTWLASSAWFHRVALRFLGRQAWMKKREEAVAAVFETVRVSLCWRTLTWSVAVSVLAWGLEGVGFAITVRELGFTDAEMATLVSIYAVATLVGAFSFVPGGIGITEASLAGLLVAVGVATAPASAATLITRAATLWLGVGLGWAALATRPDVFARLMRERSAKT